MALHFADSLFCLEWTACGVYTSLYNASFPCSAVLSALWMALLKIQLGPDIRAQDSSSHNYIQKLLQAQAQNLFTIH